VCGDHSANLRDSDLESGKKMVEFLRGMADAVEEICEPVVFKYQRVL